MFFSHSTCQCCDCHICLHLYSVSTFFCTTCIICNDVYPSCFVFRYLTDLGKWKSDFWMQKLIVIIEFPWCHDLNMSLLGPMKLKIKTLSRNIIYQTVIKLKIPHIKKLSYYLMTFSRFRWHCVDCWINCSICFSANSFTCTSIEWRGS